MTDENTEALDCSAPTAELDVGTPVEWMVDPEHRETILGVTYVFSGTGERMTVWYTPNKRKAKHFAVVSNLREA